MSREDSSPIVIDNKYLEVDCLFLNQAGEIVQEAQIPQNCNGLRALGGDT